MYNIGEVVLFKNRGTGRRRKGVVVQKSGNIYTVKGSDWLMEVPEEKISSLPKYPAFRISCDPLEEDHRKRIEQEWWYTTNHTLPDGANSCIFDVRDKLLTIGGHAAVLAFNDPDDTKLLERGVWFPGEPVRMVGGRPGECHTNLCVWYSTHPGAMLCTGYALSKDGLWRQHSWCLMVQSTGRRIIETTLPRVAYYGYVMTVAEADDFCEKTNLRRI